MRPIGLLRFDTRLRVVAQIFRESGTEGRMCKLLGYFAGAPDLVPQRRKASKPCDTVPTLEQIFGFSAYASGHQKQTLRSHHNLIDVRLSTLESAKCKKKLNPCPANLKSVI